MLNNQEKNKRRLKIVVAGLIAAMGVTTIAGSFTHKKFFSQISVARADDSLTDIERELVASLPGTKTQAAQRLDRQGLKLILNDQLDGAKIEFWKTTQLTDIEAENLMARYGVRAVWTGQGDTTFVAPNNVGRAGIREGNVFMSLNGKIYKGLTLKGYGANNGNYMGEQPQGSLAADEAIRDMEMSTILAGADVDTYVGVLSIERPGGKSNYIRLSRTALRMEDLTRFRGKDLEKLVDYMTTLLQDELGKKLSSSEFAHWIATKSADLMARKDHIRFHHASITPSNLGIGELVDLGDMSSGGGMKLPGQYQSQTQSFRTFVKEAYDNVAGFDSSVDRSKFDSLFNDAYNERLRQLKDADAAKINLSRATDQDLIRHGFTPEEAGEILKYNIGAANGILDPMEIAQIQTIGRDVRSLLEKATTDFMRLSDGSDLARYYVRNAGGSEGLREILKDARSLAEQRRVPLHLEADGSVRLTSEVRGLSAEIERLALTRARAGGFNRAAAASELTNFAKFIAKQALVVLAKR